MVSDSHRKRLGIEGFPPEYSMYQAMLVEGGFHGKTRDGAFRLRAPTGRSLSLWKPVWREAGRFLMTAREQQRPLTELIESLKAPPFGLREGPLPVLITAMLRLRGEELALYEDGLFVPEVGIETLERLVRRPHTFSLRCYRLNARERRVIEELGALSGEMATEDEAVAEHTEGLIAIVRQLVRLAERLPPYAQHTRHRIMLSTPGTVFRRARVPCETCCAPQRTPVRCCWKISPNRWMSISIPPPARRPSPNACVAASVTSHVLSRTCSTR